MFSFIFIQINGMHVINLVLTVRIVTHAYKYVQTASQEGKQILFIGTKRQAANTIAEEAKKCGASFIAHRWLGGTLTNWPTIRGRVKYLKELSKKETSGELELLPKKEAALLRKKREKLLQNLGGLTEMVRIPDIAIVVDPRREETAIAECCKLGIKIIAIVDTNCDPSLINIPIPANNDGVRSIRLIISKLSEAIATGKYSTL
jgi:small subunit ribosomal protein S2